MRKSSILQTLGVPKYYLARQFEGKFVDYYKRKDLVISSHKQRKQFKGLMTEEPGWLAYISAPGLLFNAGILASDIAQNYLDNKLNVRWLHNFDARNSSIQDQILSANLVVFDALFYDGHRLNRDMLYATISRYCQRDDCSVIVIGQAPSPVNMVTYLGLPPNYVFQVA